MICLPVQQFEDWFQKNLESKYIRDVDHIFSGMRVLFLIYSRISKLCREVGTNLAVKDPYSIKVHLDNILHLIHALVENIPTCIDYDYLIAFCNAAEECFRNINVHLHPVFCDVIDMLSKI